MWCSVHGLSAMPPRSQSSTPVDRREKMSPWTAAEAASDAVSKKMILAHLQENSSAEFLSEHKLTGQANSVLKRVTKDAMVEAYKVSLGEGGAETGGFSFAPPAAVKAGAEAAFTFSPPAAEKAAAGAAASSATSAAASSAAAGQYVCPACQRDIGSSFGLYEHMRHWRSISKSKSKDGALSGMESLRKSKEGRLHERAGQTAVMAAAVDARWREVLRQSGAP